MSDHGTRRRWTARAAILGLVVAGLGTFGAGSAQAVHDEEFQLDTGTGGANTVDDAAAAEDFDWENFFAGPGDLHSSVTLPNAAFPGFQASGGRADYALPDSSTYATGSKDTLPIAGPGGWQCSKSNNVGDKVDIVNSYATAYIRPSDNHLILYYGVEKSSPNGDSNIAVWFLKDGTVDCSTTAGGAKDWTGHHVDGDILLVSAFTNGGSQANVNAYEWQGDDTGFLSTTPMASGQLCGTGSDDACSVVNTAPITPPWNHPDKNGGALDSLEFFEGGVDAGPFGASTCFATAVANTRSSQSLTATLFDFDRFSLPVCGKLEVQKYIDVDMSGTSNTGDVTSGAAVGGWAFSVKGPSPSTTEVCAGTTGTDGKLVCGAGQSLENLLPGTYSITETQKSGFFNTDAADNTPDPTINENATVTGTITVGVSGGTAKFGNTCFVDKTFQITSVPDSVNSVSVEYRVMTGTHAAATYTTLSLDKSGTTYSKAVNDTFNQGDTIAWRWYINGDTANKIVGATEAAPESLATFGYPTCAKTNTDQLDLVTLQGFKFKDVNGDAAFDAGDTKAGGWEFTLKRVLGDNSTPGDPSDDPLSAVLQTVNSESSGANIGRYQFTNVAPGTYRIFETGKTGWVQTQPSSPAYRQVTVVLGATSPVSSGDFLNTPTARIDIDVTSLASLPGGGDAMKADSISCVKTAGNTNVADLTDADATGNGYQSGSVRAGSYTCTVVIIDP